VGRWVGGVMVGLVRLGGRDPLLVRLWLEVLCVDRGWLSGLGCGVPFREKGRPLVRRHGVSSGAGFVL